MKLEFPCRQVFVEGWGLDFLGIVQHHLRGPKRLVCPHRYGDSSVSDRPDLTGFSDCLDIWSTGVFGEVVADCQALDVGWVDRFDIEEFTHCRAGPDAIGEAFLNVREGEGELFFPIVVTDQSHSLDRFRSVGKELPDLGSLELLVIDSHRDGEVLTASNANIARFDDH